MKGFNYIGVFTFFRKEYERVLRIPIQTVLAPLIQAFLFIFIFGFVLGSRIEEIAGVSYMQFVFPGILTMSILMTSFEHTSTSVFFNKWIKSIHEMLVAPFSYIEMLIGYVGSAVIRALITGFGVLVIGLIFGAVTIEHPIIFVLATAAISSVFAMIGILVALWAKGFEQLGILNTFIISPLTMLGGMFYSIEFLPEVLATITKLNPFFYIIGLVRYSTIGITEANLWLSVVLLVGLFAILSSLVIYLFRIGWRIRD